jgi:ketosteroid isomerase-like protein
MLTTEDLLAIHQVQADYGHVVDDHDWDRAHLVFAPDFVFAFDDPAIPDLHGIADVVATFKGRNAYAHHTTNVAVTEQDGVVRVHSKLLLFPNEGPPVSGDYFDEMTRTPDGWRIGVRRIVMRERRFFD